MHVSVYGALVRQSARTHTVSYMLARRGADIQPYARWHSDIHACRHSGTQACIHAGMRVHVACTVFGWAVRMRPSFAFSREVTGPRAAQTRPGLQPPRCRVDPRLGASQKPSRCLLKLLGVVLSAFSGPEMGKLKWVTGKLKWETKSVSLSCQDPTKFTKSGSFPSAYRRLFVLPVFTCPFRGHRLCFPARSGPVGES